MNSVYFIKYCAAALSVVIAAGSAFAVNTNASDRRSLSANKLSAAPVYASGAYEEFSRSDPSFHEDDVSISDTVGEENGSAPLSSYYIAPSAAPDGPVESNDLPSSYKTETTGIREQGSYNTCWAFSGIGALEARLSREGRGSHDFSEQHLTWWASKDYNIDGIGWLCPSLSYGGYSMISAGYFASWQGPKTEEDIPYLLSGNNQPPENMDSTDTPFGVTGIMYVDNDIESVKHAVYKYGGVATSYNNGSGYGANRSNYYQNGDASYFSGHAITIIGWDDYYSKENFKENNQPPFDGAWLVKNSWGESKGDNGYTWISYYDKYVLDTQLWGENLAITNVRTMNEYDKLYQNEKYGATFFTYVSDNNTGVTLPDVTFANIFNFDSEHKYLQKVIFETHCEGAKYTVYYIPLQNGRPVTDRSEWQTLASSIIPYAGYIGVDVSGKIEVSGKAAIAVEIDASNLENAEAQMGVDEWLINSSGDYVFMPKQRRNQSFVINGDDVYDLVDIYAANDDSTGGTLVIKAIAGSDVVGDADDDSAVTASDALTVLRKSVGLGEMTDLQIKNTDVNYDNSITATDALMILRKSVGLLEEF